MVNSSISEISTDSKHFMNSPKMNRHFNKMKFPRVWKNRILEKWWLLISLAFLLEFISNCGLTEGAIKKVNLVMEPPAVRRGHHATLKCLYDLEGAPLYSVKFYRGQLEFYRYSPGEMPSTKVFPFPGIQVDVSMSNASQVVIRNVGFGLSGNFCCEITADAPYFSTAVAFAYMQVVELPEKRPTLWTEHDRYEPGDVLKANCSSPPSRPKAELKLLINNWVVPTTDIQYIRTVDNLIASRISMKLHLQSLHFAGGNPGGHAINSISSSGLNGNGNGIVLKCVAEIGDLYEESAEIELGVPQRDPIPARVTSSDAIRLLPTFGCFVNFLTSLPIYLIIISFHFRSSMQR